MLSRDRKPVVLVMGAAVGASGSLMVHTVAGLALIKSGLVGLFLGAGAGFYYFHKLAEREKQSAADDPSASVPPKSGGDTA